MAVSNSTRQDSESCDMRFWIDSMNSLCYGEGAGQKYQQSNLGAVSVYMHLVVSLDSLLGGLGGLGNVLDGGHYLRVCSSARCAAQRRGSSRNLIRRDIQQQPVSTSRHWWGKAHLFVKYSQAEEPHVGSLREHLLRRHCGRLQPESLSLLFDVFDTEGHSVLPINVFPLHKSQSDGRFVAGQAQGPACCDPRSITRSANYEQGQTFLCLRRGYCEYLALTCLNKRCRW